MIGKAIDLQDVVAKSNAERMKSLSSYVEEAKNEHDHVGEVWFENVLSRETGDAEMVALASANPRARLPMRHIVLSWPEDERPTPVQARESVRILLRQIGCERCLAKCAMHNDTDNVHLHVVVCTVDPATEKMVKTSWLHENVLKAVAVIEAKQGWTPESNARYTVDDAGKPVRTNRTSQAVCSPSERALRQERFTGQRSATDIAIEAVTTALGSAKSWAGLHSALAQRGLSYKRKGSGAVVGVMQDGKVIYLKASAVHRGAALTQLAKKFGEYVEATVIPRDRAAEPARAVAGERKGLWQQYKMERDLHVQAGKARALGLRVVGVDERGMLYKRHSQERQELYSRNWRGHGPALIALRSVLAAKHAAEKAELQERLAERRLRERKERVDFVHDFAKWLEQRGRPDLGDEQRAPSRAEIRGPVVEAKPMDIRDFGHETVRQATQFIGRDGRQHEGRETAVRYARRSGQVDYSDVGRSIRIYSASDSAVLRASLQLAAEKWPHGFRLHGSVAYRRAACIEAARLGLLAKVTNPELQGLVNRLRSKPATGQPASRTVDAPVETAKNALNPRLGPTGRRMT